jgi:hypothetical protein
VTLCGSAEAVGRLSLGVLRLTPYSVDSLTGAEYFFGNPEMQVAFVFVAAICTVHQRSPLFLTAVLTVVDDAKPAQ